MLNNYGEAKEVGRLPGRTPGLAMMQGHAYWVIRRKDVTAKQQLLFKASDSKRPHHRQNKLTRCAFKPITPLRHTFPAAYPAHTAAINRAGSPKVPQPSPLRPRKPTLKDRM
jgi:hypothetical protein